MQLLDHNLVIGIDWQKHPSKAAARQALTSLRRDTVVAGMACDDEYVEGVVSGFGGGVFQKARYAGALLIGGIEPTISIHHTLPDGLVWVCAVSGGIPLHGYDTVVDGYTARSMLSELRSLFPDMAVVGDAPGAISTMEQFLKRRNAKLLRAARLRSPYEPLAYGAIVLLLAALSGLAWHAWQTHQAEQAALLQAEQDAALAQARAAREAKRLLAREKAIEAAKAGLFDTVPPLAQFGLWHDVLRQLPVSVEGWRPSAMSCQVDRCTVAWTLAEGGVPSSFSALPGEAGGAMEGKVVNTSYPLTLLAAVPQATAERIDLSRYLSDLSATLTTTDVKLTVGGQGALITPQIAPELAAGAPLQPVAREGSITLEADSALAAAVFLERLDLPGVSLKSLRVEGLDAQPRLKVEAVYRGAL